MRVCIFVFFIRCPHICLSSSSFFLHIFLNPPADTDVVISQRLCIASTVGINLAVYNSRARFLFKSFPIRNPVFTCTFWTEMVILFQVMHNNSFCLGCFLFSLAFVLAFGLHQFCSSQSVFSLNWTWTAISNLIYVKKKSIVTISN